MRVIQRIVAVVIMVISIAVLVLSVAAIAGTWSVRAQLTADLMDIATAAETRAARAGADLDRLDTALGRTRTELSAMEQEVRTIGADLDQNTPLLTAISDKLGIDLAPLVEDARALTTSIQEAAVAVNGAIEAINAIPFMSKSIPELEALTTLSGDMKQFWIEFDNLRTMIEEKRSEIIAGGVSLITTPTAELGTRLDNIQGAVSGLRTEIRTLEGNLSTFKSSIGTSLTWVAAIITLILLWLALSQVALFVLGWRALTGRDIVPRKERETTARLAGAV